MFEKVKKKQLGLALGLFLIMPQLVMAQEPGIEGNGKQAEKAGECKHGHHHLNDQQYQQKWKEKEQKLLSLVDHYTPDKKAEWAQVMAERNKLHAKWLSPEFAKKREQWQKEKWTGQKNPTGEGKGTKEEFFKKDHVGMKREHWKMYHQLKAAVKNNNDKEAAKILNQILTHYKHHNEMIKQAMGQTS